MFVARFKKAIVTSTVVREEEVILLAAALASGCAHWDLEDFLQEYPEVRGITSLEGVIAWADAQEETGLFEGISSSNMKLDLGYWRPLFEKVDEHTFLWRPIRRRHEADRFIRFQRVSGGVILTCASGRTDGLGSMTQAEWIGRWVKPIALVFPGVGNSRAYDMIWRD